MKTLAQTLELIQKLHGGVLDKGGEPYWMHPFSVMMLLPGYLPNEARHAALLHDVVEDTDVTLEDLRDNYGYMYNVTHLVDHVTKDPTITYQENIDKIIDSGNVAAMEIKLADNYHNMDRHRPYKISESMQERYTLSSWKLEDAIKGMK
jgi:(p)ppGpp synthase/HD superfamily hydrolase